MLARVFTPASVLSSSAAYSASKPVLPPRPPLPLGGLLMKQDAVAAAAADLEQAVLGGGVWDLGLAEDLQASSVFGWKEVGVCIFCCFSSDFKQKVNEAG
jgi:hypothetical protein